MTYNRPNLYLLGLSIFLTRDWVILNNTLSISHSSRPLTTRRTRNVKIMESLLPEKFLADWFEWLTDYIIVTVYKIKETIMFCYANRLINFIFRFSPVWFDPGREKKLAEGASGPLFIIFRWQPFHFKQNIILGWIFMVFISFWSAKDYKLVHPDQIFLSKLAIFRFFYYK